MISEISGYLSGLAILASFIPYIRDIFWGKTKPERMSWLIWSLIGSISFSSQFAKGASYSLLMTGAQTIGDLFIFVIAIKYGVGGFIKRDVLAIIGTFISLFLWYLTKEASLALLIVIFIDAMGALLTVIKSYKNPETETVSAWVLTFIGGFLGCIAVGKISFILLAFPAYVCLASLSILLAIKLGSNNRANITIKQLT